MRLHLTHPARVASRHVSKLLLLAGICFCAGGRAEEVQKSSYDEKWSGDALFLRQSPGATIKREENDYGLGDSYITKLLKYPPGGPGVPTPFDLYRYAGKGENSWGSP